MVGYILAFSLSCISVVKTAADITIHFSCFPCLSSICEETFSVGCVKQQRCTFPQAASSVGLNFHGVLLTPKCLFLDNMQCFISSLIDPGMLGILSSTQNAKCVWYSVSARKYVWTCHILKNYYWYIHAGYSLLLQPEIHFLGLPISGFCFFAPLLHSYPSIAYLCWDHSSRTVLWMII